MQTIGSFIKLFLLFLVITFNYGCSDQNDDKDDQDEKIRNELLVDVVYKNNFGDIYTTNFKGSNNRISQNGRSVPKWSPDGSKIAFLKNELQDTVNKIFLSVIYGNQESKWFIGNAGELSWGGEQNLTWSPDGQIIAVACPEIWYFNALTGEKLEAETELSPVSIAWCSKNNKIAYSMGNAIRYFAPFEKNPSGETLVLTDIEIHYMDWDQNGERLVYSPYAFGPVHITHYDGTNNHVIILQKEHQDVELHGIAPCWTDNGEQIIFWGANGVNWETLEFKMSLHVTNTNGDYDVDLVSPGGLPDCKPK